MTDHLGTPRMVFDQTGNLANVSRHDYLPFGEELFAGTGGRTTAQGYTANDSVRQKFTQKERDIETGLDYFGARYYASTQGRFTGIDPGPFTPADPQNFNRYSYVQNNPLKFIDPTGKELVIVGEAADDLISELERSTGYKLKRDKKTGRVTIDPESKRETKGTSKNLADKVKEIIGLKDKNGKDVTVDIRAVRDTDGEGKALFVDRFATRSIDVNDLQAIGKSAPELSAALVGHVLEEYQQAATTFLSVAGAGRVQELGSHNYGLAFESQVLSDFTGVPEQQRRDIQLPNKVTFFYTSVQYDIETKTSPSTITNVVKKQRQRSP